MAGAEVVGAGGAEVVGEAVTEAAAGAEVEEEVEGEGEGGAHAGGAEGAGVGGGGEGDEEGIEHVAWAVVDLPEFEEVESVAGVGEDPDELGMALEGLLQRIAAGNA
jgi:hypothetical protein